MIKICTRCFNTFAEGHDHSDCPLDLQGAQPGREIFIRWPIRVRINWDISSWGIGTRKKLMIAIGPERYMASAIVAGPLSIEFGWDAPPRIAEVDFKYAIHMLYLNLERAWNQDTMKRHEEWKTYAEGLIQSHQNCHRAYEEQIKVMCGAVTNTMESFDLFAAELERDGHGVRASRLIEISSSLIWGLEDKARRMRRDKGFPQIVENEMPWLQ